MRIKKLARMGLAEVADRSRQKASRWVDRVAPGFGIRRRRQGGLAMRALRPKDATAVFELFRDAAPRRFFRGAETGEAAEILREQLPAACRDLLAVANGVCTRRFDLLGYEGLSFGESIDWHLDPIAGRRAPMIHWSRIDALDPSAVGDSKVTWELNRHQWLLPLPQAYWLTADRRFAQEAADLVDAWSRSNPYGMGLNWASSLEVSYRLISWAWAIVLIRDANVLSPEEFAGLLAQIRVHGAHIERYLSTFYSPNTHLTGEALGLFYAGVLFPELPESARCRRLGRDLLTEESRKQIHDDGVYFEQATCYQRYTIDIYLHFLILAARNDVPVAPEVAARVQMMLDFLLAVGAPDGSTPTIGDADGGTLLPLVRRGPSDSRGTFAVAAAFFDRPDYLWAAGGSAPEVLWLLGASGWDRLSRLQPAPPAKPASMLFPTGGYAVMRSDWGRKAHQLIMDVGPLGCSISGAHGHADLLSVQCAAFGETYVVDPGTFCYTPDKAWRNHFRGSSAHSTVVVDRLSQSEPAGPFSWHARPAATVKSWTSSEAADLIDAVHDGYNRLADPVRHRRRVLFVKPRFWVIVDDLSGKDEHDIELRFQFASGPLDERTGTWLSASGRRGEGLWLAAFSDARLSLRVAQGATDPPEGWVSAQYGRKHPAPIAIYSTRSRLPLRMITLVLPAERLGSSPPHVTAERDATGRLSGLTLHESGDVIRCDDRVLIAERSVTPVGSPS